MGVFKMVTILQGNVIPIPRWRVSSQQGVSQFSCFQLKDRIILAVYTMAKHVDPTLTLDIGHGWILLALVPGHKEITNARKHSLLRCQFVLWDENKAPKTKPMYNH